MPLEKPLRRNGIPQEKRGYALVCLWPRVRVQGERERERALRRCRLDVTQCGAPAQLWRRGCCSVVQGEERQCGRDPVVEERREREEGKRGGEVRRGELNRLPSFWRRAMDGGRGVWLDYYSFFFFKEIRKLPFQ